MLVPYTPIAELSEEEKRRAASQQPKDGFIIVNGKVVNVNELKAQAKPPVRQNLFE
jgi:hypothetical protein